MSKRGLLASTWPPVRITIHDEETDDEVVWEVMSQVVRDDLGPSNLCGLKDLDSDGDL